MKFGKDLGIQCSFASVEYLQTNGQVEVAKKVILNELKKWLGETKWSWVNKLHDVFWAYHLTP